MISRVYTYVVLPTAGRVETRGVSGSCAGYTFEASSVVTECCDKYARGDELDNGAFDQE